MEGDKTKVTIHDYARMCKTISYCPDCPLSCDNNGEDIDCDDLVINCPEIANEIILRWVRDNLLKTRQNELLKLFPNIRLLEQFSEEGVLEWCPTQFESCICSEVQQKYGVSHKEGCTGCYKKYWLEEI